MFETVMPPTAIGLLLETRVKTPKMGGERTGRTGRTGRAGPFRVEGFGRRFYD